MSEKQTLGTVVEFTGEVEFPDGETIVMSPSRPSKAEALAIGWAYYGAAEVEQDAMLDDLGPVLVRRSLMAFRNYASRTGQRDVAAHASLLRDEVEVVRAEAIA